MSQPISTKARVDVKLTPKNVPVLFWTLKQLGLREFTWRPILKYHAEVTNVFYLCLKTEGDVKRTPGLGKSKFKEIKSTLKKHGLALDGISLSDPLLPQSLLN